MYGVQGRTWVALGDPVGPDDCLSDLIRLFLERCNDFDGVPVFYEVSRTHLHRYADFGLTFVKAGEEAKVDLRTFTLEGGHAAKHRQAIRYLQRDGGVFRIVLSEDVPGIMGQLRTVSDEWLADKAAGEKGFSLGFFDETYLSRFPVAVIERAGRIQAFANVLSGREAPKGVMEALLVHLLQWGKEQGYAWFALGMAPLSGFEQSPVGSLWNRVGAFLYEHADSVYNFVTVRYLSGPASSEPLSVKIYSAARSSPTPAVNAAATIMLVTTLTAIAVAWFLYRRITRSRGEAISSAGIADS